MRVVSTESMPLKALFGKWRAPREASLQPTEVEVTREELQEANAALETRVRLRTAQLESERREVLELSSELLRAQDEERHRISRELHDSTGQLLVALAMNLARFKSEWGSNPSADALVDDTTSIVQEMTRQLRTMSYLLHPPLLDEMGLVPALECYIDGFSKRSGIQVGLDFSELGRLPAEMEITLFRLVQESLTNVHRHSGSRTAQIRLNRDDTSVNLEVVDQGTGFKTANTAGYALPRTGVGIPGMKERVRRFGGTVDISSSPGGTNVRARLPISQRLNPV